MKWVLGVDEAGRGPLAGPVAVGIVCAPEDFNFLKAFPGLNDSKKLTEAARQRLFKLLLERVDVGEISHHVEFVSPRIIDEKGITHAVRRGVYLGVHKLLPDAGSGKVWLDGLLRAPEEYEQETVVKGDGIIPAIMLASVAAKVVRDQYMVELAEQYPQYGFERHKGYGTLQHRAAIRMNGVSKAHRATFCKLI